MFTQILFSFLPNFIQIGLRRLGGAKIGKNVKIKFGTVLLAKDLTIGDNVTLGPFSLIEGRTVIIKDYAQISYMVSLRARFISIGYAASIQPNNRISGTQVKTSKFILGDHSMVLPYCYMDPGEGITIGNKTGIGGYSLLFTHGSWPDHLNGGPISFGPIVIEDNVWLPWRVFVLPNVTIGSNAVIGGNSLVNKSIPKNGLAAGSPARVLKEVAYEIPAPEERKGRMAMIIKDFFENEMNDQKADFTIEVDSMANLKPGDLLFILQMESTSTQIQELQRKGVNVIDHEQSMYYRSHNSILADRFKGFISKYGIRLYISEL